MRATVAPECVQYCGGARGPRRKEDIRFLTGRGNYVADIQRPGMVAGVFVRSPHAHAKIKSINAKPALSMPGVLAVFTGEDLKAGGVGGLPCGWGITGKDGQPMKEPAHPVMALGKVRHVGDPVAFVVAETLQQAQPASEKVIVDYELLPAVVGLVDALKPGAPRVFDEVPDNLCCDWELGDSAATDAAFR
jgi:carbon-monoxide dehydrogenase large subunit